MYKFELKDSFFLPHHGCQISLRLNAGEAILLVGENGVGKSTLLKKISTTLPQDQWSMAEQKTAAVFYDRKLSFVKNYFLKHSLFRFNADLFLSAWKGFGLEAKEHLYLSTLSGGETQALKLTMAFSKDVPLYFFDEPSQYLDSHRKNYLISAMENLLDKKKSLVVIEHDVSWLPKGWKAQELVLQDRVLKQGRLWTI